MIGLLQRVSKACVEVDNLKVGDIQKGLLVFIGVEKDDNKAKADRLLERLLGYRVFSDVTGKMNLCLKDIQGGLLVVPQFTLSANTTKGTRPGFSYAAIPETGKMLFEYFVTQAKQQYSPVAAGQFGTNMQVSLTNDGPVTFWLQV